MSHIVSYSPASKVIATVSSGLKADYYTDGVADDVQIQAACTSLDGIGGEIKLHSGTFIITSPVTIPSNVTITGEGRGNTIIKLGDDVNDNLFENSDQVGGNTNINVSHLTIDGNKANQTNGNPSNGLTGVGGKGFFFKNVTNTNINNVEAHDTYNRAYYFYGCEDGVISECEGRDCGSFQEQVFTFELCNKCIYSDCYCSGGTDRDFEIAFCTNCELHNCVSESPAGSCLAIYSTGTANTGIIVDGFIAMNATAEGIYLERVTNSFFDNIWIYNPGTSGIKNFGTGSVMADNVFSNIFIYNPVQDGISTDTTRGVFSNIKIYNAGLRGIRLTTSQCKLSNIFVDGAGQDGLWIGPNSHYTSVTGSTFKNSGQDGTAGHTYGIRVESLYNTITGNRAYDDQTVETQTHGIREVTPGDYNVIVANNLYDNATPLQTNGSNTVQHSNLGSNKNVVPGYLTIGSGSTPTNSTAGDLTGIRFNIGDNSFSTSNGRIVSILSSTTDTASGSSIYFNSANTYAPTSNASTEMRSHDLSTTIGGSTGVTLNTVIAGRFNNNIGAAQNGAITAVIGVVAQGTTLLSTSANATIGTLTALKINTSARSSGSATATVTDGIAIDTGTTTGGSGYTYTNYKHLTIANVSADAVTTQYGIDIGTLTRGTTDIGIRIAKADTYTLQLSDTGGTAAGGITFGTDTTLYRSAADTLKTDDTFIAATGLTIASLSGVLKASAGAVSGSAILNDIGVPTSSFSMNSQKITSLADPGAAQDAATKAYVDSVASGLDAKASVRVATTVAGTLATSFENGDTIDGVVLATGDRILIKNQASGAENGIYTVNASGAPTRATDADVDAEVTNGMYCFVTAGSTQSNTGWVLTTANPITVGSTSLSLAQFSAAATIVGGSGLTLTGNTLDIVGTSNRITANADSIDISSSYVGQTSITTLGTITTGVWTGSAIPVANGGTGAATAATARTNLGLGTIATQDASNVTLTGGTISGITDLAVADGGTGASDATTARTNLGLGSIATQASSSVTITGGSITGITDLAVADGGTGSSTASGARTSLGLGTIATQDSSSVTITGGTITGVTDIAIADGGTAASTATTAFNNLSPLTTQGDIIYHNGTNNVRLAKGTALQHLRMNSGATAPEWFTSVNRTFVELGSDVASTASTSFQNITGLSFAVTSGVKYRFYVMVVYTCSVTTIGLRLSLTSPATTLLAYNTRSILTTTGSAANEWTNGQATTDAGTSSTSSPATTGNIAIIEGYVLPSASGTVQFRFAPETATASGIVIKAGSTLEYW